MKRFVFVGPTGHGIDSTAYPDFEFLPPASCGDILRLASVETCAIGLVDGSFQSVAAVWHKEILFAIDNGCSIFGASSMGALRAAECAAFGMIGVGRIFRDYASGRRLADSDVAIHHAPQELGYLPLSVPIVDVEYALKLLFVRGIIDQKTCDELDVEARRLYFADRTWSKVFSNARLDRKTQIVLHECIGAIGPLLKARDFLLLLDRMRKPDVGKCRRRVGFYETKFFARLAHEVERQ